MKGAARWLMAAAAIGCLGAAPASWHHPADGSEPLHTEMISIAGDGSILLAPESVETAPGDSEGEVPPLLWAAALDLKGTLYAAGGLGARVIRAEREGDVEPFFEVKDLGVRSLAADVAGNLYVATFPTGRVYRLSGEGDSEVWFEPEERYIWAMTADAFDRLFVASGERGIIFMVTGPGEGGVFFDSDEPHITALAADPAGRLIAGSAGRGLLYRIDSDGSSEVLLDSPLDEISAITAASDGTIYAASIRGPGYRSPRRADGRRDELTVEVRESDDDLLEEAAGSGRKIVVDLSSILPPDPEALARRDASQVYRILPGRTPEEIWSSRTDRVYSLAIDPAGRLLIGTGPSGKLMRLEPDGSATLVQRLESSQITAMLPGLGKETHILASNPGRAYRLRDTPATSGTYLSPVHDSGAISSWGVARWEGDTPQGTRIELEARSGNTHTPDETWSSWSEPTGDPSGTPLRLPAARFIQWRASLSRLKTNATPVLWGVTVTYLPENRSPRVTGLKIGPPGGKRPAEPPSDAPGKEAAAVEKSSHEERRRRWISWESSDPDGDALTHRIAVKLAEEGAWTTVSAELERPPFHLSTADLAEGRYILRLLVTDAGANAPGRELAAEARTNYFIVDQTPPVIVPQAPATQGENLVIPFQVQDAAGIVASVEWSEKSDGPWRAILPEDGIPDTASERFRLTMAEGDAPRRIYLRARDDSLNETVLEVGFTGSSR